MSRFSLQKLTPIVLTDCTSTLTSPIITLVVGPEARLFAAHADVLCHSPFFAAALRGQFLEAHTRRIDLPDEAPEIFSSVLEYLYKGDYYPRLLHNKRRNTWELEGLSPQASPDGQPVRGAVEPTVNLAPHPTSPQGTEPTQVLKDTVIYCVAEKFSLPDLKRLALRKQGLQQGVQCSTIISSARYAYEHTPESDGKMRAHYLALIIRCRGVFKRSGTMQMEMEKGGIGGGGGLWFDLFVAMSGHLDDVTAVK